MEGYTQLGRGKGLQASPPRRGRGLLVDLTWRGRGLRPPSPPQVGRGLLTVSAGRGRGLRPISAPHLGRGLSIPQLGSRRGLRSPASSPPHPGSFPLLWWEQEWGQGIGPIGKPQHLPTSPIYPLKMFNLCTIPTRLFPQPPGTIVWIPLTTPPGTLPPPYQCLPHDTFPCSLIDLTMGPNNLSESFEDSEGPLH